MRAVVYDGAGGNEVVRVENRLDPVPGPEDVIVDVHYAGLNPADLQQREGNYPAPPGAVPDVPGLEVSGRVVDRGERVTSWDNGDRVFGLVAGGGLASRVLVHERAVARVPDALDDREAAAIPEAFITAHDAVAVQAALRPGETLLVHGAAGGVGSAAVQIALGMGATVLGSVRNPQARQAVESLGATPIDEEDFAGAVQDATGGRGADVILELVGAPHFPANVEAVALRGRIVVVSVAAGREANLDLLRMMQKRASLRGTVLRARPIEEKGAAVRAFEKEVVPALGDGRMRPLIDSVFPADRVTEAFDRLASRGKVGKVLLDFA